MITVYAQNFEDVLLWRALGHIEKGRYVDVGAYDPDMASVTRLFYEHGWRGINIEPVPAMFEKLEERRPEDVNLKAACSEAPGELILYEVVGTGLSTLDAAHAEDVRASGWTVVEHKTPVCTLDSILEKHSGGPIHFLKIDVVGAEKAVIDGCDLTKWRPWLLVIEATAPLSQTVTSDRWESPVLEAGYTKVYFDGLNNYYASSEHAELAAAFTLQPNCFDNFALAADHGLVNQEERLSMRAELTRSGALLTTLESLLQRSEDWTRVIEAQLHRSEEDGAVTREELMNALGLAATAREETDKLRRTVSWRVTAPLRGVRRAAAMTKEVTKPLLEAVRGKDGFRSRARRVLRVVPAAEATSQGSANNQPDHTGAE